MKFAEISQRAKHQIVEFPDPHSGELITMRRDDGMRYWLGAFGVQSVSMVPNGQNSPEANAHNSRLTRQWLAEGKPGGDSDPRLDHIVSVTGMTGPDATLSDLALPRELADQPDGLYPSTIEPRQ